LSTDEKVLIELERLLETEGYSTVTAWSGRDALALSTQMRFDFRLVDEHLADIDATTLLDALHQTRPNAFQLVMHSCGGCKPAGSAVYKWAPDQVKAKIRNCLAA
jgi:DNA-binding NtrC family response regulator